MRLKAIALVMALFASSYLLAGGGEQTAGNGSDGVVTYRDVMDEFDHYLAELDNLDREESHLHQQRRVNPSAPTRIRQIALEREHLLRKLARMQEELEMAGVNIVESLLGSMAMDGKQLKSTGKKVVKRKAAARKISHSSSSSSSSDSSSDSESSDTDFSFVDLSDVEDSDYEWFNGTPEQRYKHKLYKKKLKTTRKLVKQKNALTMQQIGIAAKLGSINMGKPVTGNVKK